MSIKKAILFASIALTATSLALVSGCGGSTEDVPSASAQKIDDNAKNSMMEYMKTKNAKGGKRASRN